jgi:hypothetical protein
MTCPGWPASRYNGKAVGENAIIKEEEHLNKTPRYVQRKRSICYLTSSKDVDFRLGVEQDWMAVEIKESPIDTKLRKQRLLSKARVIQDKFVESTCR